MSNVKQLDFVEIYKTNGFQGHESISGPGSDANRTHHLRRIISDILHKYTVKSLIDIPCGDINWMQHVDLSGIKYIGGDIVPDLIESNIRKYASKFKFCILDLRVGPLPQYEVIFCRDCFVHMPFVDIKLALDTIKKSGCKWLLTTTFPQCEKNIELESGIWRPLNLQRPPFNLPTPKEIFLENPEADQSLQFSDKSIGLWDIGSL